MRIEYLEELIKTMPIEDVSTLLKENRYSKESNQEIINILASEIARRLYKGNPVITYEMFRANYGYVDMEVKGKTR